MKTALLSALRRAAQLTGDGPLAEAARGVFGALAPQWGGAPAQERPQAPHLGASPKAQFLARSYSCAAGARDYKIYVPGHAQLRARALVVMLHGCGQSPDDFAAGAGMNPLAEEHGLLVAYPGQARQANHMTCWNWYERRDQMRGAGEPEVIAGLTRAVVDEFAIDPLRVFVAGFSAGGAMAEIMGVAYPDLYAAAGVHSGLVYGAAHDIASAFAAMSGNAPPLSARVWRGAAKKRARTIVFHGDADRQVHPENADFIVAAARSTLAGPTREARHAGLSGGRAYRRTVIFDARGVAGVEHWRVEGLGHAWSGGRPHGSHTDLLGPDASREMLRFFLQ